MAHGQQSDLPVIADLHEFDLQSGTFLEKLVFNNRAMVMILCLITTLILGYQAFDEEINIKGVILNKLGGYRHEDKLRKVFIVVFEDVNPRKMLWKRARRLLRGKPMITEKERAMY